MGGQDRFSPPSYRELITSAALNDGEFLKKGERLAEIYDLYGDVLEVVEMPVDGYVWAYPCGSSLGTSGSLQAVQSGANIAYAFAHEKDCPP